MAARAPRASSRALQTTPEPDTIPPEVQQARTALARAAITIASFRWKLRAAAYPFREPPGVDLALDSIDAVLYPEERRRA
jgi:hypothetical protein